MCKGLWKRFHEDPALFKVLAKHLQDYKRDKWPKSFVDCVFQYDWHHSVDIYDIYALVHATLWSNGPFATVRIFQIPVGTEPLCDADIDGNNAILGRLPSPFEGRFWGGTQGADGIVRWKKPIHVSLSRRKESGWALVDPGAVELEVGYNSFGKFMRSVQTTAGLARWPYGQSQITVFLNSSVLKCHTPDDPSFQHIREESGETIEGSMKEGRSPWERWADEIQAQRRARRQRRSDVT